MGFEVNHLHPYVDAMLMATCETYYYEFAIPGLGRADFVVYLEDHKVVVIECKWDTSTTIIKKAINQVLDYCSAFGQRATPWIVIPYDGYTRKLYDLCKAADVYLHAVPATSGMIARTIENYEIQRGKIEHEDDYSRIRNYITTTEWGRLANGERIPMKYQFYED